ncbi:MAG: hypothetical protein ACLQD8_07450 [Thermoplasmata archaeon]
MGSRRIRRATRVAWALTLFLGAFALVGVVSIATASPGASPSVPRASALAPAVHDVPNSGGSSGSSSDGLCPSSGPVILGIDWNCVAVLNLTELGVFLASIGIIAYVFKDSDEAELPGESAEVPVTAAEWDAYREARRNGVPYEPPRSPGTGGAG